MRRPLWLLVLLAGCAPRPRTWEYLILDSPDPARTSRVLDSLGTEGWELVAPTGPLLYLKRPMTEDR